MFLPPILKSDQAIKATPVVREIQYPQAGIRIHKPEAGPIDVAVRPQGRVPTIGPQKIVVRKTSSANTGPSDIQSAKPSRAYGNFRRELNDVRRMIGISQLRSRIPEW
ncbi:MAG: hypothetical protein HP494_07045 [Nitrospira sp.]|nr:hypothetical protein [Nitrospira sp.]